MKKELPKLYKGKVNHTNNLHSSYGLKEDTRNKNPRDVINELFKKNHIYRQDVEIETIKDKFVTKIIGRTNEHVITINNVVIKIEDIINIKILK